MVERDVFFYETTPSHIVCTLSFLFPFSFSLSLSLCLSSHVRRDKWRERRKGEKEIANVFFVSLGESALCCRPVGVGLAFLVTQLSI